MSVAKLIATMGGVQFAQFITEHHYATTGVAQAVSFTGAAAGDLAILIAVANGSVSGLSSWTHLTPQIWGASQNDVYWKVLTSAEIAAGSVTVAGTSNGGLLMLVAYRGATSVSAVSSATATTSSLTLPGFTKAVFSKALVTYVGEGESAGGSIASPSSATARTGPYGSTVISGAVADILPSAAYANGVNLVWTGIAASGSVNAGGQVLELT